MVTGNRLSELERFKEAREEIISREAIFEIKKTGCEFSTGRHSVDRTTSIPKSIFFIQTCSEMEEYSSSYNSEESQSFEILFNKQKLVFMLVELKYRRDFKINLFLMKLRWRK